MDWPILHRRNALTLLLLGLLVGFTETPRADPSGLEVQLRLARGPYYVGEPIEVHLQVTGLERSPEPSCHGQAPAGARLEWRGTQPSVSSSMRIEGGQVTRTETITFTCQFVLVPSQPGRVRIDPLEMRQGAARAQSEAHAIQVESVPQDSRLKIEILPRTSSMVLGQRVSVRIEWQLDAELDEALRRYSIRSPLFEMPDTFRFLNDASGSRGTTSIQIQTSTGEIAIPAQVERRTENNREYLVLSAERTLMPLKQGRFNLEGPTVSAEEVTRWQRDLFGSRRPAASRRLFAQGEALNWTVGEAPSAGRPESFAGAIGQGFSLEAIADRSVVKRGDPIELTLVVRGQGHLGSVGIPKLDRVGALSPDAFRISGETPTGEIIDGAKQFRLRVRVLDDSVREIPAIEYAWFDPEQDAFQTTRSRPIALSVRPADLITAADVIRPAASKAPDEESSSLSTSSPTNLTSADAPTPLANVDLSIDVDLDRLSRRAEGSGKVEALLYGFGILLVAAAFLRRRGVRWRGKKGARRAHYQKQRAVIESCGQDAPKDALRKIVAALRALAADNPTARRSALNAFLQECDEILYAPNDSKQILVAAKIQRALELAEAIMRDSE